MDENERNDIVDNGADNASEERVRIELDFSDRAEYGDTGIKKTQPTKGKLPPVTPTQAVVIAVLCIIIAISAGVVGYYVRDMGTHIRYVDRETYKEVKGFENFDLLTRTLDVAQSNYYKDLDYDAIDKVLSEALVKSLDSYSTMTKEIGGGGATATDSGIGIQMHITEYNEYYVEHVYTGSAADGILRRGDKLLGVTNDSNGLINYRVDGLDYAYLPACFAGPAGTVLLLYIQRGESAQYVRIEKGPYVVNRAWYINDLGGDIPDSYGYIHLGSFTDRADEEFAQCIADFLNDGNDVLILDLRNNGGGNTTILGKIGSYLISDGKGNKQVPIIKFGNDAHTTFSTEDSTKYINKPIYVLTNGNTASASEALLSAMMYYGTATAVLGTTTYGKGVGQSSYVATDDDGERFNISLTTGRYYTFVEPSELYPDGLKCIDGEGLIPDVVYSDTVTNRFYVDLALDTLILKVVELQKGAEE